MSHHHRRSTDMAFIMDAYGQQPSTSVSFMAEDDTWGSDRDTSSHTLLPPTSSQATDSYIFNATKNVPALDPLTRSLPSQRASNETTIPAWHHSSSGNESAFDDTFTYVISRSKDSSIYDDEDLFTDMHSSYLRHSNQSRISMTDEDNIVSQYIQPPSSPKLVHRRPTESNTPVFERQGLRRQRTIMSDSGDSFDMISAYGSDQDSLFKYDDDPFRSHKPNWSAAGLASTVSSLSRPKHLTDKHVLPADYHSATLAGGQMDDFLETDREWDESTLKLHQYWSLRGTLNVSVLILIVLCVLMLFMGYPVLHEASQQKLRDTLKTPVDDQPRSLSGLRTSLIDPDTPLEARTSKNSYTNKTMKLVFSDEFNQDGRSFYPGEDPFWEAENLHYWQTENYEWYHPSAITTANGSLVITLSQHPLHNLFFRGGMLTSWNKFCFTGGKLEARLILPGRNNVSGLWPAVWTMGNLGRAGYGASTEGLWPYSYDSCDVGTLPNQTYLASQGGGPLAAETTGRYVEDFGPYLSYLPGQRLSRCTCLDSTEHPGPRHEDGTWVGRSAPEIDLIEALGNNGEGEHGQTSMSLQVAPFDAAYNVTDPSGLIATNGSTHASKLNDYTGAVFQQAVSAKVNTSDSAYTLTDHQFDTYAFEYNPGTSKDSYIKWFISNEEVFRIEAHALGPNKATEIGARPIPEEPMYLIMNLGISQSFNWINWDVLSEDWNNDPSNYRMLIDYVRVYQDEDKISEDSISCSPSKFPTAEYIEKHMEAYTNPLLTSWVEAPERGGYNHTFPPNVLLGQCK